MYMYVRIMLDRHGCWYNYTLHECKHAVYILLTDFLINNLSTQLDRSTESYIGSIIILFTCILYVGMHTDTCI